MKQIILDIETTGLDHNKGERIIEIACIELIDRNRTDEYEQRFNPQHPVSDEAYQIHGIGDEDLADQPLFVDACDQFLEFISDSEIIAHNASFDIGFINAELRQLQRQDVCTEVRCTILDTLELAQKKHPGMRNSLNALCKRYNIALSGREKHGALIDAELLRQVYLSMTSVQISLDLKEKKLKQASKASLEQYQQLPIIKATEQECHDDLTFREKYLKQLKTNTGE